MKIPRMMTKYAFFILMLCAIAVSPQEPQYSSTEKDARKKTKSIKTLTDEDEYYIFIKLNTWTKDDRISELRQMEVCQPICKTSNAAQPWYIEPTMESEDREFYHELSKI